MQWIAVVAAALVAVVLWRLFAPRWRAIRRQIDLVCTCGYVAELPANSTGRVARMFVRTLVWAQVGRVAVTGAEHLQCASPRLIAPTHGHYLDPFVLALVLPDRMRFMAARGLLRFGGGFAAPMLARCGLFCTDLDPGKGAPALKAAVGILASGQTLLMFPEGWANMDGVVGSFKKGAASVARLAEIRIGRPVAIVPVYLRYGAYPGSWIRKFPTALQCLIILAGFAFFRRGVDVVIGAPLLSSQLPTHAELATERLRDAVMALGEGPQAHGLHLAS